MEFTYKAVDSNGTLVGGKLEADSSSEAVRAVAANRLIVVDVRPRGKRFPAWIRGPALSPRRLATRDVVAFTQGLASLLKAGVLLDRALSILGDATDQPHLKSLYRDLSREIRAGVSFSDAIERRANLFPHYYLTMIQAGEAGGSLAAGLDRLTLFVQRAAQIKERLVSALIYPAMLMSMIVATITIVLTVILPRFKSLFAEAQTSLPLATRAVIALGDFVGNYGIWLLILAGVVTGFLYRLWRDPVRGERIDRRFLKSRLSFGLIAKIQTGRFLRTLGTLAQCGVPLPMATGIAIGMFRNRALILAARQTHRGLKQGESLSSLLAESGLFPRVAVQLARVGEESGRLHDLLLEAAETLERDAHGTIERLLSILVPAITIAMGAIVAALIASVLVGILSLNDLAF